MPGIAFEEGLLLFAPRWGMTRECVGALAVAGRAAPYETRNVIVALTATMPVVVAMEGGQPERELVLLQEYEPGTGAKRYPGFYVDIESSKSVRILASESTRKGSGSEKWTLLIAPLGWAADIAAQFVDKRDYGSQTIVSRL